MALLLRSVLTLALALALLAGCAKDPGFTLTRRPIINGEIDETHTSVVALVSMGQQFCTGTVIAPRAILTAGHCVQESGIPPYAMQVFFGTTVGEAGSKVRVTAATVHPQYYVADTGAPMFDVAVLTLADDAPVPPMAWQRTALDGSVVGETVTMVGYGVTNAQTQTGNGTRRVVDEVITDMDEDFIYYGGGTSGTCQGDSGGPTFRHRGSDLVLIAVTSWGDASCVLEGGNTRVDKYADFITPLALLPVDLAVSAPADGATLGSEFSVSAEASTPAGVAEVDLFMDGTLVGALTAAPYAWDLSAVANGEHVLTVKATGADGAVGERSLAVAVFAQAVSVHCTSDAECQSGRCADAATGRGYCTQSCQTSADCPNSAACLAVAGEQLCGPAGSAASSSACAAGGGPAGAATGLVLLGLALLVVRRRRA
jgi:MYXO-CTERM domain-containing protein